MLNSEHKFTGRLLVSLEAYRLVMLSKHSATVHPMIPNVDHLSLFVKVSAFFLFQIQTHSSVKQSNVFSIMLSTMFMLKPGMTWDQAQATVLNSEPTYTIHY